MINEPTENQGSFFSFSPNDSASNLWPNNVVDKGIFKTSLVLTGLRYIVKIIKKGADFVLQ